MCAQFGDEFALAILAITRLCHDENATVGPNLADERSEVRPVKTKMKVSGQFKNEEGAASYTSLHSIIQTARIISLYPIFTFSHIYCSS